MKALPATVSHALIESTSLVQLSFLSSNTVQQKISIAEDSELIGPAPWTQKFFPFYRIGMPHTENEKEELLLEKQFAAPGN